MLMQNKFQKMFSPQAGIIFCRFALSYCGAAGVANYYFSGSSLVRQSFLTVVFCAFVYLALQKAALLPERVKKLSCLGGAVYAAVAVVGKAIYETHGLSTLYKNFNRVLLTLLMLVGLWVVIGAFLALLLNFLSRPLAGPKAPARQVGGIKPAALFFSLWGVIFLFYIPCLLAYYPGIYSYDMKMQTEQALGKTAVTKFHPPLHTFLWQLCLKLSGIFHLQAVTVYALLQMLVVSAFFAFFCCYVKGKSQKAFLCCVVWFALNPVLAIFSIIPTKDVLFSVFFGCTALLLHHAFCVGKAFFKSPLKVTALLFSALLSCLFRNNAIYVFVVAALVFLLFFKGCRLRLTAVLAGALAAFLLINGPVFAALKVKKGNSREMFNVPVQQIALVVVRNEKKLTPKEVGKINQFLDYRKLKKLYNPRFADPVKCSYKFNENIGKEKDFIKFWLKLGLKYPKEYITAFLELNIPYWYMDADSVDPYAKRIYIETLAGSNEYYSVRRNSKLPFLYSRYEKVANYSAFQKLPVISNLFSISTPIWAILFTAFWLIFKKRYRGLLNLVLPFLLWATYLLGPVSNFRYILPIFMLYPFFVLLIAQCRNHEKGN